MKVKVRFSHFLKNPRWLTFFDMCIIMGIRRSFWYIIHGVNLVQLRVSVCEPLQVPPLMTVVLYSHTVHCTLYTVQLYWLRCRMPLVSEPVVWSWYVGWFYKGASWRGINFQPIMGLSPYSAEKFAKLNSMNVRLHDIIIAWITVSVKTTWEGHLQLG